MPTPAEWTMVPEDAPAYLLIGYGALDLPAFVLARAVLRGQANEPARPDEDAHFVQDRAARETAHQVWSKP